MAVQVLGFSGSPVRNSNTDRVVRHILEATGLTSEFIKLSEVTVRPCLACKRCVTDNVCKEDDDFPSLARQIKDARAVVLGAYEPYGQIDAFTKALLERLWSFRHLANLLEGKILATVVIGLDEEQQERVNSALAEHLRDGVNMDLVGQLKVQGAYPCHTCGVGHRCKMVGVKAQYGSEAELAEHPYIPAEGQEVWQEAEVLGRLIGERVRAMSTSP